MELPDSVSVFLSFSWLPDIRLKVPITSSGSYGSVLFSRALGSFDLSDVMDFMYVMYSSFLGVRVSCRSVTVEWERVLFRPYPKC